MLGESGKTGSRKKLEEGICFFEVPRKVCSLKLNIYGLEFCSELRNTDRNVGVRGIKV